MLIFRYRIISINSLKTLELIWSLGRELPADSAILT